MEFKDKKVAILGFGGEGASAANFLIDKRARVFVFDVRSEDKFEQDKLEKFREKGISFKFNSYPQDFSMFDLVVRSPGVSVLSSIVEKIKKQGIVVTSVIKIFFDLCPCPIIGVTGTKGKGTTSALIYEMLKKQGIDAYLGGNIGLPPLEFLSSLKSNSRVILELSSFQLQDLHKSPQIAVFLMVTSEHLDYHRDIKEYIEAKRNILRFQGSQDFAILNKDYPVSNESDIHTQSKVYYVSRERDADRGCYIRDGFVVIKPNGDELKVIPTADILLPGKHNFENACAATMVAYLVGVEISNIAAVLKEFKGLEHRLELVRIFNGVAYYDDSFSTTPETAIAAIEAFEEPEILVLGGSSKNSDFTELGKTIREAKNIKAIIGIGDEWPRVRATIDNLQLTINLIEGCTNMEEIVRRAREIAKVGDVVILSPACASFDMFPNYKERGNQFKKEVNSLV